LLLEERAQRIGVDRFFGGIRREKDVGLVEGLALGDDIAAVEPLQHDAREHEVGGRGADIDPDAQHADLVFSLQAASGGGKENPAAGFIGLDFHSVGPIRSVFRATPPARSIFGLRRPY
jgi:hypothetical protein